MGRGSCGVYRGTVEKGEESRANWIGKRVGSSLKAHSRITSQIRRSRCRFWRLREVQSG